MNKLSTFLCLILVLSLICGAEGCIPENTGTEIGTYNTSILTGDNASIEIENISSNNSISVEEIQQNAEQMLQENICNLLPTRATRLPGDLLRVGVKAPNNLENGLSITFPPYYLWDYNNETYYACFTYGQETSTGTKNCLIPFTADLMDENLNKITTSTGAIKLTFEGSLEELKDNPDYIPPTQDGPAPKNFQQLTKIITPTFTRTGCELQIDEPCEVPEGYSFCGRCSYSIISFDQLSYRGQCAVCSPGTSCSNGNDNNNLCAEVSCISNTQNNKHIGITQKNYFTSCSNCQTGQYRSYNYNGPDYYTCSYYYRICAQSQCADKRTNCG